MACELYGREVGGPECGALWLHVIAYNTGAIRLYEGAGFVMAEHLPAFYHINGERHDAYLYVKYLWPPPGASVAGARGAVAVAEPEPAAAGGGGGALDALRDWI